MSFVDGVRAHLPRGLTLPGPFAEAMDWLDAQGWGGVFTRLDQDAFSSRYLSIYPPETRDAFGASHVLFSFEAGPPLHEPGDEAMARVATVARIAGDGGTLSLWLDDAGKQWVVVFNHGMPHVLTDDPVIALQFLAIGYLEPGALIDAACTPQDDARADPVILPDAFRNFIESRFDVKIPPCAADLGIKIPPEGASDPMRDWIETVVPPPDPRLIPGQHRDNPFVITGELKAALGPDGIAALKSAYAHVVDETKNP